MDIEVYRQTVISFPDDDIPDITSGISSGSLVVDEVLCTNGFNIGECNANRFEAELYDIPDINNKKIYVHQLVYEGEDDETPTDVPLFTGYVDSCVRNRLRQDISRKIIAYDALYALADRDVAEWWENLFDTVSQVTLKTLRESLCTYVGLNYDSTITLPNDSLLVKQTQQINSIKFIEVLKYICQLQACNANISREGQLQFIHTYNNVVDITDAYEINNSDFESYTVPAFTKVKIINSINDANAVSGEGNKSIVIQDNLLILDKTNTELQTIANVILQNIGQITYHPASIKLIVSNLNLKVGDIVHTDNGDCLICESELSGAMLIEQKIIASGTESYNENTTSGYDYNVIDNELKGSIEATSTKYYRYISKSDVTIGNTLTKPILSMRYIVSKQCLVMFQGVAILDVTVIDDTQPSEVELQYEIAGEIIRTFTPTETYIDGRHTFNMLFYWDSEANINNLFRVLLTCTNCTVKISAYRLRAIMSGVGLLGDEIWNGYIDVEDTIDAINLDSISVEPFTATTTTNLITPHTRTLTDTLTEINLDSISVDTFTADTYINKTSLTVEGITWGDLKDDYSWADVKDKHIW